MHFHSIWSLHQPMMDFIHLKSVAQTRGTADGLIRGPIQIPLEWTWQFSIIRYQPILSQPSDDKICSHVWTLWGNAFSMIQAEMIGQTPALVQTRIKSGPRRSEEDHVISAVFQRCMDHSPVSCKRLTSLFVYSIKYNERRENHLGSRVMLICEVKKI
jgi:hypothetical protein